MYSASCEFIGRLYNKNITNPAGVKGEKLSGTTSITVTRCLAMLWEIAPRCGFPGESGAIRCDQRVFDRSATLLPSSLRIRENGRD